MAFKLAEAFVELRARGMSTVGATIGRVAGAFASLARTALNTASVIGSVSIGVGAFKAIKLAAEAEQIEVAMETMIGSATRARKVLRELYDMGARTPFEFTDLAKASRTLLSFGENVDDLLRDVEMLSNIAAGDANKLESLALVFGQIQSTGRLMGQDLLQLINQGFNPLQQIAERTGETMAGLKKRMEQGKISFAEVKQAFVDATSEGGRFYQMNEKQSRTLMGVWSTLQDVIGQALTKIGKAIVETFDLKKVLEDVAAWVDEMVNLFDVLAANWTNAWEIMKLTAAAAIQSIVAMMKVALVEAAGQVGDRLQAGWKEFWFAIKHPTPETTARWHAEQADILEQQLSPLQAKQARGERLTDAENAQIESLTSQIEAHRAVVQEIHDAAAEINRLRGTEISLATILHAGQEASKETVERINQLMAENRKTLETRRARQRAEEEAVEAPAPEKPAMLPTPPGLMDLMGLRLGFQGLMMQMEQRRFGRAEHIDSTSLAQRIQESILDDRARRQEEIQKGQLKVLEQVLNTLGGPGINVHVQNFPQIGFG